MAAQAFAPAAAAEKPPAAPSRLWLLVPLLAAAAYVAMAVHAARVETPTVDEMAHVASGVAVGKLGRLDVYWRSPPASRLWMDLPLLLDESVIVPEPPYPLRGWGPWAYGMMFMKANESRYLDLVFRARLMVIPWGLLAGAVIFLWSRSLWGVPAACVAASLWFLCPNTLAHGHLGTIDMACAATVLLALFVTRWACRRGDAGAFACAGAAIGFAVIIKFTAILIIPVALLTLACHRLLCGDAGKRWRQGALRVLRDSVIVLAVALLVINASLAFHGTGKRLDSYRFDSASFQRLQRILPPWTPVLVPETYVRGADDQQYSVEQGEFRVYLMGMWSDTGWWYYNLVALLVKTPETFTLLVIASLLVWRPHGERRWWEFLAVWLPVLVLVGSVSAFGRMNIGLRYVLPAMPLLFIASGGAIAWLLRCERPRFVRTLPWIAVGYTAVIVAMNHPHHLGFFNPASGGPAHGHAWLLDSNIDWGQDLYRVRGVTDALLKNAGGSPAAASAPIGLLYFGHADPALYDIKYRLVPPFPVKGVLAVSVNFLLGQEYVVTDTDGKVYQVKAEHLKWLRDKKPIARVGSIWIFDTR